MEPAPTGPTEGKEQNELQFLTFTDFSETKARETKKKIKGHIMKGRQRALKNARAGTEKDAKIVLDTTPLMNARSSGYASQSTLAFAGSSTLTLHSSSWGAGSADPFQPYPIPMDLRSTELVIHLRGAFCPMFKTLSKVGFFANMQDPAGFRQVLCTSSKHMCQLRKESESVESIGLSTLAISSVNKRLSDPVVGIGDGIIATILAFICHAIMFQDIAGARLHRDGVYEIIRRRGGIGSLSLNASIRTVLFWVDTNVSFMQDTTPRFPIPETILPAPIPVILHERGAGIALPVISQSENMTVAVKASRDLNHLLREKLAQQKGKLWEDGLFCGYRMVPVLHRLLSIRREVPPDNAELLKEEACRLGILLYFSAVRIRFGVGLDPTVCTRKLKATMALQDETAWDGTPEVKVWLLLTGAIQSFGMQEEHDWFVAGLARHAAGTGYFGSWAGLISLVREVLWVDDVFDVECVRIRGEVSNKSLELFQHPFS